MFKQDFKYYKSKRPPPDLSDVLDFNSDNLSQRNIKIIDTKALKCTRLLTLKPSSEWTAFTIESNPGLIFIENPFTPIGQRYWITRCLKDYTKKPNKLNIDAHNFLTEEQDWWDYCRQLRDDKFTEKLRWATLGYHHNWETKVYSDETGDFPKDLATLCKSIAQYLNLGPFEAEAAIVNFYHMDSTLSGHTDHSEKNLDAPLFSFSFGQSAIFLIGGPTIDEKPSALFLHSGDIVIMSKRARLSYHGVPKILSASNMPWTISEDEIRSKSFEEDSETFVIDTYNCLKSSMWIPFENYVSKSRININVRQVLCDKKEVENK